LHYEQLLLFLKISPPSSSVPSKSNVIFSVASTTLLSTLTFIPLMLSTLSSSCFSDKVTPKFAPQHPTPSKVKRRFVSRLSFIIFSLYVFALSVITINKSPLYLLLILLSLHIEHDFYFSKGESHNCFLSVSLLPLSTLFVILPAHVRWDQLYE